MICIAKDISFENDLFPDAQRRFMCQCNSGYIGNGTACKEVSQYEGNFLLVNQGMATLRLPLDNSKSKMKRPIQVRAMQTAVGLDIDCLEGRAYWSDIHGKAIRSALFNGSSKADFITNRKYSCVICVPILNQYSC